ncbi:MAG TPA: hypothetical protein VKC66_15395 [Xanthobacteraceae bacterium]|nr:hypothetical protein [Xanthobacteraceae bacterium]
MRIQRLSSRYSGHFQFDRSARAQSATATGGIDPYGLVVINSVESD